MMERERRRPSGVLTFLMVSVMLLGVLALVLSAAALRHASAMSIGEGEEEALYPVEDSTPEQTDRPGSTPEDVPTATVPDGETAEDTPSETAVRYTVCLAGEGVAVLDADGAQVLFRPLTLQTLLPADRERLTAGVEVEHFDGALAVLADLCE